MPQQPTQSEAISRFLNAKTHSDLAQLYHRNMEVQVNVLQGNGERIKTEYLGRQFSAWTDGSQTWKDFRIPYKANTEPEYTDKSMSFDLVEHVEGIGLSGWDWVNRVSKWVAFDFDAIAGHSEQHDKKLTSEQLREVEKVVWDIPWITIRRSTSGKGLHLYVFLNDIPTKNHSEHAALARSILGLMNAITGYDFTNKVDVCGHIMWVWHRKMLNTDGLKLIKSGITLTDIPSNWRDHIPVVSGKRKRPVPEFVEKDETTFEELAGQRPKTEIDETHKSLFTYLAEIKACWWWDADHHMLVTHTYSLKRAFTALNMVGIFDTLATGKEEGQDHNCFCFPLRKGGWVVRRYSRGVGEAKTWVQDANGWTTCYLNRIPDLLTAARTYDGVEDVKGNFVFKHAKAAVDAAKLVGIPIFIPDALSFREAKLKEHKDGRLIVEVKAEAGDAAMPNWLLEGNTWRSIHNGRVTTRYETEIGNFDEYVRHLTTVNNEDCGWSLKVERGWRREPLIHVKTYLASMGMSPREVTNVLGSCVGRCWTLVNKPFQSEYPGDRQWNCSGAKYAYPMSDDEELTHPTWDRILAHTGAGLDEAIKDDPWSKENGINTGADYLRCWLASMLQQPHEPLPYLFFYGPQMSGKSIFHEACDLLIVGGVIRGDVAVISDSGFNAELEGNVLVVIEETDLGGKSGKTSYNRIKDWVTSRKVLIHPKRQTPYTVVNTTHWVQCANDMSACPVFPGDSRITVCYVDRLAQEDLIPKKQIMQLLEKEAPHFLTRLLRLGLPSCVDRLNIPVIMTQEKMDAEQSNKSHLELFISEQCHHIPGSKVRFAEFFDRFRDWLDPSQASHWSKIRVGRELPKDKHPKGRGLDSQFYVCNLSFDPDVEEGVNLTVRDDKIIEGGRL